MLPADLLLFESPAPGKIRLLTWFSAVVMVFCVASAFFIFQHMTRDGLSPELAPLWSRALLSVTVGGFGGGFFTGMLIYLRFYATRLTLVRDTDLVRVETLRLFGRRERTLASPQITSSSYHHGHLAIPGRVEVEAPWFWVSVNGKRGFLLDAQGKFPEPEALAKLLSADPYPSLIPPST